MLICKKIIKEEKGAMAITKSIHVTIRTYFLATTI